MHNIVSPRPTTDETVEDEIRRKGLTAPRVTPQDLENTIQSCYFFTAEEGILGEERANDRPEGVYEKSLALVTFCVLVLHNGYTVDGVSYVISPENFDAGIGKKVARQNAVEKIWPLLGYELRTRLAA